MILFHKLFVVVFLISSSSDFSFGLRFLIISLITLQMMKWSETEGE
jgi:hypothetical protein